MAYYTMLGLFPDGSRVVLCLVNHPTEGALNWELELNALKEKGIGQIDLIISDVLQGIVRGLYDIPSSSSPLVRGSLQASCSKSNIKERQSSPNAGA